ncbi:putative SOS response-associated peptidase YedK [Microbacteriaceae bacterium MWH-Ta3]|nr:putative SOS response-associated peptidase YedK [Microbacteriaceae bacterium MWH-Ta3]
MCGRYASTLAGEELGRYFAVDEIADVELRPSWNIAPTTSVPIIVEKRDEAHTRLLTTARWSLVPPYAESLTLPYPTFNARSETVCHKPTFRAAVAHQRALLPADGYFEWHTEGRAQTPYFVHPDSGLIAFAGIYSWWRESESTDWVLTASVLTMPAVPALADIHDRTPMMLGPDDWSWWLDREATADDSFMADAVARSIPVANSLTFHEVAPLRGNGPELVLPVR